MYDTKYFERVPGRCGGRVTFIGSRLEPGFIKGMLRHTNPDDIKSDYNLTDEQLRAAANYVEAIAYDPESEQKYLKDMLSNKEDSSFGGVFPGRRK